MPRQLVPLYDNADSGGSPASQTSTGTADVKTFTPPKGPAGATKAIGALVTVETNAARVTIDGTSPGAGDAPGVLIPAGLGPQLLAVNPQNGLKFASSIAGNSRVSVIWLT